MMGRVRLKLAIATKWVSSKQAVTDQSPVRPRDKVQRADYGRSEFDIFSTSQMDGSIRPQLRDY
jgi:hypothetical protein